MASDQQFCLRWNNHQSTLVSVFDNLLESQTLVDCTLAADGQYLKAHKVVLSACSPYLEAILCQNLDKHPILILKDVKFSELKAMLDYMYRGEVNISQEQLSTFLKAAESLQIKGLTDSGGGGSSDRDRETLKRQDLRKPLNQPVPILSQPRPVVPHAGGLMERRSLPHFPPHIADMQPQSPRHAREGSTSPTARKRRRPNRPSSDDSNFVSTTPNSLSENQPDTSDSCDVPVKQAASTTPNVPNAATKAPETDSNRTTPQPQNNQQNSEQKQQVTVKKEFSEALLTPKTEFDYGNDNSMEDVTYEDDEEEEVDLSKPGTSFAANSQGFPPWQMGGDGSNDDSNNMYSPDVTAATNQNNSQESCKASPSSLPTVDLWDPFSAIVISVPPDPTVEYNLKDLGLDITSSEEEADDAGGPDTKAPELKVLDPDSKGDASTKGELNEKFQTSSLNSNAIDAKYVSCETKDKIEPCKEVSFSDDIITDDYKTDVLGFNLNSESRLTELGSLNVQEEKGADKLSLEDGSSLPNSVSHDLNLSESSNENNILTLCTGKPKALNETSHISQSNDSISGLSMIVSPNKEPRVILERCDVNLLQLSDKYADETSEVLAESAGEGKCLKNEDVKLSIVGQTKINNATNYKRSFSKENVSASESLSVIIPDKEINKSHEKYISINPQSSDFNGIDHEAKQETSELLKPEQKPVDKENIGNKLDERAQAFLKNLNLSTPTQFNKALNDFKKLKTTKKHNKLPISSSLFRAGNKSLTNDIKQKVNKEESKTSHHVDKLTTDRKRALTPSPRKETPKKPKIFQRKSMSTSTPYLSLSDEKTRDIDREDISIVGFQNITMEEKTEHSKSDVGRKRQSLKVANNANNNPALKFLQELNITEQTLKNVQESVKSDKKTQVFDLRKISRTTDFSKLPEHGDLHTLLGIARQQTKPTKIGLSKTTKSVSNGKGLETACHRLKKEKSREPRGAWESCESLVDPSKAAVISFPSENSDKEKEIIKIPFSSSDDFYNLEELEDKSAHKSKITKPINSTPKSHKSAKKIKPLSLDVKTPIKLNCEYCYQQFGSEKELVRHNKTVHSSNNLFF